MISNEYRKSQSEQHLPDLGKDKQYKNSQLRHQRSLKSFKSLSNLSVQEGSQMNDSHIDKFYQERLSQIIFKLKVDRNVQLFIHKLKRNASTPCKVPMKIQKPKKWPQTAKILSTLYHIVVVVHYLSIIAQLLLTSWTATIVKFNQEYAHTEIVIAVKVIALAVFCTQQACNSGSHFCRDIKGMNLTLENVLQDLVSYNSITNFIKIMFSLFFLIFPHSYPLAALFFVFLVVSMFIGVAELSHLEAAYIHTEKRQFIWQISRILGLNILMIHIMATIVNSMAFLNETMNWLIKFDMLEESWIDQYITAYYWSTIIVTTIGFGDFSASNSNQKALIAFLALVACILLAYNISSFSKQFGNLTQNYQNVELRFVMFYRMVRRDYKNNVDIDPKLKVKIYKFLHSLSSDKRELEFVEKNQFLAKLPQKLRKQYYRKTNKLLFATVPFFKFLRNHTLSALSQNFQMLFLEKGETMEPNDESIKILQVGQIDLTYSREGSTINGLSYDTIKIGKRENVGLLTPDFLCLLQQSNYNLCARSFSVVWSMTTQNFLSILQNDIIDFEYFFNNLHRHHPDQDQWGIIPCPRCSSYRYNIKHSSFRCPKLSYMPIRKIIVYKSFKIPEVDQPRWKIMREKAFAPRISVLKYWKRYFKKNFQFQLKRDQQSHIKNLQHKQINYVFQKQKIYYKDKKKVYHHYCSDKQRRQIINDPQNMNFEMDVPFNFEFYLPQFNPSRLIFTEVEKCEDFGGGSSIVQVLRHVKHMRGKFQIDKVQ